MRVPGDTKLSTLADCVLEPLMGWARNYHAHTFTDMKDGAVFGPEKSMAVDMMHMDNHGWKWIPDSEVHLADVCVL